MNLMKLTAAALVSSAMLVGCGGGGKDAGTSPFGSGSGSGSSSGSTSGTNTGTASSSSGTVVLALSSTVVSSSSPGVVTALVKDASGAVITNAVVNFTSSSTLATVNPTSALTDGSGQAATTLVPAVNAGNGAAYVNASVDLPGGTTLTTRVPFSVTATGVSLVSVTPAQTSLGAYASTAINVVVSSASSTAPVTLNFGSTCVSSGKATISPASLVLTSTTGSVTYQDNGCAATDAVNVQISGTTQQISRNLVVAAPTASSLKFVTASPDTICIFGSGCAATSTVTFQLIDQSGVHGIPGAVVNFVLDQPQAATLGAPSGTTDANGNVTVSVSSKAVPSPVRVSATLAASTINTVSNALTIQSGRPYQDGISLAATTYSLNYNLDGDSSNLRLQLVDRFGNPVPDGTVVNLVASGGSVIPASCTTAASVCNVQFVVSNPRPANGRVAIVAYAQGEETFIDANSNNVYDTGESFTDLGPVTLDRNGNGVVDGGENLVGAPADGVWSNNGYVRISTGIFMSKTSIAPRLFQANSNGTCSDTEITGWSAASPALGTVTTDGGSSCRVTAQFCLRDGNTAADTLHGNPVVSGATLALSNSAGGATVTVDNTPVPAVVSGPTRHIVTAGRTTCATALTSPGNVDLTVTLRGNAYIFRDILKVQ